MASAKPSKRLQLAQAEVNEVLDLMRVNVDKVLEREQKINELEIKADTMQERTAIFEASAASVKSKFWWKNFKMKLIIGGIILIIIIGIVVALVLTFGMGGGVSSVKNIVGAGGGAPPAPAPPAAAKPPSAVH